MSAVPLQRSLVRETPCASLARFEHPADAIHLDTDDELAENFQLGIVESGWFQFCTGNDRWLLGSGCLFVTRPGESYAYKHHPHLAPDVCVTITFKVTSESRDELPELFRR